MIKPAITRNCDTDFPAAFVGCKCPAETVGSRSRWNICRGRRTTRENAFLITAWKFSWISPLQNPPESVRAGFAVEGKRFCHCQKTVRRLSTCASLVRTLRESQNKQYSFRGPFRPGNFFKTAYLCPFHPPFSSSAFFYRVSFPSPLSFEWSTNFSIVLLWAWMAAVRDERMGFARTRKVLNCRVEIFIAMFFFSNRET